jgi:hypothetical protein
MDPRADPPMSHTRTRPVTLKYPLRVISPLATAVLGSVMFLPPLVLADWSGPFRIQVTLGVAILLGTIALFVRSGFRAPFEMRFEPGGLYVRRLLRETRYELADVASWRFAVPNAPATQAPPPENGVLFVTFTDRTRFRAEVTHEEAVDWVNLMSTAGPA